MLPIWAMMALAGAAKAATIDKDKEKRDRTLAANTQRYAPWTGLRADPVQEADPFGKALSYGVTGAGLEQSMENADSENALRKAQADAIRNGRNIQAAPNFSGQSGAPRDSLGGPWWGS